MNYAVSCRLISDTGDVCDMVELVDFPMKIVHEDLFIDIFLVNQVLLVTGETRLTLLTS